MSKTPVIGGIKMKKLGKGKPGNMKALVKRHLGDKAADKITKSDGAKLVAKGKKTGDTNLVRKGSFIKNMMKEDKGGPGFPPDGFGTDLSTKKMKKMTPGESDMKKKSLDELMDDILNDPAVFTRMRRKELSEKKLTPAEKKKREDIAQAIARDNPDMPMDKKMAIATATAKRVAEDSHADGSYSKKKLKMAADAAMELDGMLGDSDDLPEWVQGKITKAADYLDSARDYMKNKGDDGKAPVGESAQAWKKWAKTAAGRRYAALSAKEKEAKAKRNRMNEDLCCDDCNDHFDHVIEEATYQGKKVTLNDPIRTSENPNKKFKVYVKDGDKIKVVRFGDPNLSIKRDDPERRKSFRARHNCDNPGPKTKPRYWSCYQWRSGAKVDN